MRQLRSFKVEGLFHSATHKIDFTSDGPVTIIAGPNGVGKTHILRLIKALLAFDVTELAMVTFEAAVVTFIDGRHIIAEKYLDEDGDATLRLEGRGPKGGLLGKAIFGDLDEWVELASPRYRPLSDGRFFDSLHGRIVSRPTVRRWLASQNVQRNAAESIPWFKKGFPPNKPIFIDTKRLDAQASSLDSSDPDSIAATALTASASAKSRIDEYIETVRIQVEHAKRDSLLETQKADQSFAARVLDGSREAMKKEELKLRYDQIYALNAQLHRNGLSSPSVNVQFPASGVTATQREVLTVFVEDWAQKISPLLPVNEKLKTLRKIINEKFDGKSLELDSDGTLYFLAADRGMIPVGALSSGEQHVLALFTMLLFSTESGSVVLIDEPEISLHAAWKHAFLEDITDVAQISDLQVVFATHSSAIINGQWDLVQELGVRR